LLGVIGEGVLQIVRLLHTPRLFIVDVGVHDNMPAVVGVGLMVRQLIGGVLGLVVLQLALRLRQWLYLPGRGQFWRLAAGTAVAAVKIALLPVAAALLPEEREYTRPWESQPSRYDTSQTYLLFFMLHACLCTICFVFCYTSWHFYAFSGTNLLTRCHSASSLFSAVFCVSKKLHRNYSRNWTKQKLKFLFFLT
jgi:hypothetical protein